MNKRYTEHINRALAKHLPAPGTQPQSLHQAMHYALFSGGKRIRPILCLSVAELLGGEIADATPAACALEILHTYTLIHDDLPCMDDDALRRGQPTCHIKFGEATALLAGDALLMLAFETAVQSPHPRHIVSTLARAAGSQGVIGGQVVDLESEGQAPIAETLRYIQLHKTADLFRVACQLGAISADASPSDEKLMVKFGEELGIAFQIIDDILDETADEATLGKPIGSDLENHKMTYPALYGLETARQHARQRTQNALLTLAQLDRNTCELEQLTMQLLDRNY